MTQKTSTIDLNNTISTDWQRAQEGEKQYWIRKTSSSGYLDDHAHSFRNWVPQFLEGLKNSGLELNNNSTILQIGSGIFDIIDFLPKGKLFAIDPLEGFFCSLNNRNRNTKVIRGQVMAEHLPFTDNTFDLVISHNMLDHVASAKTVLSECYRVLKSGGLFWLQVHVFNSWPMPLKKLLLALRIDNKHLFFWTKPSLIKLLEDSNLHIINGTIISERISLANSMQLRPFLKKIAGISPIRLTVISHPS